MIHLVVFSDLDGTILDSDTYSPAAARPGLSLLKRMACPLVPASSKTYDEMRFVMEDLCLDGPFIFENGGGIAWPEGDGYRIQEMGASTEELADAVDLVEETIGRTLIQVRRLTLERIMDITGFTAKRAEMVLGRMFSLPFVLDTAPLDAGEIQKANDRLDKWGFRITRGERFHYLTSVGASKGEAMDDVIRVIREKSSPGTVFHTVAIGDNVNDIAMLERADMAYVVRRPDGTAIRVDRHDVYVTRAIGPHGFSEAIENLLSRYQGQ